MRLTTPLSTTATANPMRNNRRIESGAAAERSTATSGRGRVGLRGFSSGMSSRDTAGSREPASRAGAEVEVGGVATLSKKVIGSGVTTDAFGGS